MSKTSTKRPNRTKRAIIWFSLAAFWIIVQVWTMTYDSNSDHAGNVYWTDAVFVEDGKIHPENEGKLIGVSGKLETAEKVTDDIIGVTFDAGRVDRQVQKVRHNTTEKKYEWEKVYEGKGENGFESKTMTGSFRIGEFEIDPELNKQLDLMSRDVKKDDFSEEDLKKIEALGFYTSDSDFGSQYWISTIPVDTDMKDHEDDKAHKPDVDWDNAYRMRWTQCYVPGDGYETIVGIQRGNTIEKCDDLDQLAARAEKITTTEEFLEKGVPAHRSKGASAMIWFIIALSLFFGIMNVVKIRKEAKRPVPGFD